MVILCLNQGTSSLKVALYEGETLVASGGEELLEKKPNAIGHRMVHGGDRPALITDEILERLKSFIPFAPLHLPKEIALVEKMQKRFPSVPQVACFDTAFHASMPEVAKRFAIPQKIHRYGFHGLSYEYIVSQVPKGRLIIAHLGHGASLAAVCDGKPMDTTMGLTPTGGIMSGTRSGDLDPGVMIYLLRQGMSVDALERLLNEDSGLLAFGKSSDIRECGDEAIELFCYQVRKVIGAYAVVLGGVDELIFTGGIGENATSVREKICKGLNFKTRVIPTNEDLMVAKHVQEVVG